MQARAISRPIGQPLARGGIGTAPDYEEPVGDDPVDPPITDPEPPTDTPTDPDTDAPEPGIDPDFVMPTRIDITDSGQTAVRTTNDPGTFGVAYVATAVSGDEYWEYEIQTPTPNNATFAVGITTLDMPLNGIPGVRATEIAWWSDGTVRQNDATLIDLGAGGALARGDTAGIAINAAGAVFLYKNCVALNSGTAVGTLAPVDPIYPFVALYSAKTRINMNFSTAAFNCAVPDGFYPLGQVQFTPLALADLGRWYDFSDEATHTIVSGFVSDVADKSGNARTMTTHSETSRPGLSTMNGLVALDFDGTNDYLLDTTTEQVPDGDDQPFTVIISFQADASAAYQRPWAWNSSSDPDPYHALDWAGDVGLLSNSRRDDTRAFSVVNTVTAGHPLPTDGPIVVSVIFTGTTVTVRVNGAATSVTNESCNTNALNNIGRFTIGASYQGFSTFTPFNGRIGEVITTNSAMTGDDLTNAEAYMLAKWVP